jgi:hypothetical protein
MAQANRDGNTPRSVTLSPPTCTFHAARLAWLDARQTLQTTFDRATGDVGDETADRLFKARRDAAWQMVRAPVRGLNDIRDLAGAVQEIFAEADEVGRPADDVHRALLDRLLREVARYEESDAPVTKRKTRDPLEMTDDILHNVGAIGDLARAICLAMEELNINDVRNESMLNTLVREIERRVEAVESLFGLKPRRTDAAQEATS